MTSDDDHADDATIEPPIWIPLDDDVADTAGQAPVVDNDADAAAEEPGGLAQQTGLPMSVLAGGAAVVLLAAAVVFGIIATGGPAAAPDPPTQAAAGTPGFTASESAEPSRTPAVVPTVECRYTRTQEGAVPRRVDQPRVTGVVKSGRVVVELVTNQGRIELSLDRARTPCTVNNFLELAAKRFFNDTPCHRITTRSLFVLQCGDPGGTGTGGPGYTFADENLPRTRTEPVTYTAGTVAMANAGPNTNGSQFFIVYADTQLMPTWTVFGQVTAGLDIVQAVADAGSSPDGDGRPKRPVTIMSVMSVPPAR